MLLQSDELPFTRWQALRLLPAQLQPFVVFMDFHEPYSGYMDLKKGTEHRLDLGPGPLHLNADTVVSDS